MASRAGSILHDTICIKVRSGVESDGSWVIDHIVEMHSAPLVYSDYEVAG